MNLRTSIALLSLVAFSSLGPAACSSCAGPVAEGEGEGEGGAGEGEGAAAGEGEGAAAGEGEGAAGEGEGAAGEGEGAAGEGEGVAGEGEGAAGEGEGAAGEGEGEGGATCSGIGDCNTGELCLVSGQCGPCTNDAQGDADCVAAYGASNVCDAGSCVAGDCHPANGGADCATSGDLCCAGPSGDFCATVQCCSNADCLNGHVCDGTGTCVCPDPGNTLFVDGLNGSDTTGNGSSTCPFLSITASLDAAVQAAAVDTVHVLGGGATQIVYSAATTNESFPLIPKAALTVVGDGAASVKVSGNNNGGCGNSTGCTFLVDDDGITISDMTISHGVAGGRGVVVGSGISGTGASFVLQDVTVTNTGAGVQLTGTSVSSIVRATLQTNGTGIIAQNNATVSLDTVTAIQNGGAMIINDTAHVSSSSCVFNNNNGNDAQGAVFMNGSAVWSSSDDHINNNARDGILLGSAAGGGANTNTLTMTSSTGAAGCQIEGNGTGAGHGNGIRIFGTSLVTLNACIVTGNSLNGVFLAGSTARADLGTPSSATGTGGNTLQSTTSPNLDAGVCNGSLTDISAANDHWSACPPAHAVACANAIDVGETSTGRVTNDATGCVTP